MSQSNKKILIISANQLKSPYPVYPIGLSYLSSYIKKYLPEFEINFADMNLVSTDELIKLVKEINPAYIGISLRNIDDTNALNSHSFIDGYKNIVETIKNNSSSKIILGGSGFSIFPDVLFDLLKPDFGVYGEGEKSFCNLVNCLENDLQLDDIGGLVYSKDGKTIVNGHKDFLHSLELDFEESLIDYYWQQSGMLNIQTKRGCPHRCIYCSYPVIEGRRVRTLDPDQIVKTLSELKFKYGIDYVFFTDSVFNIMNDYNYLLTKKIIDSKINIKWGAYFSPSNLDEETLKFYKQSGLTHIEFGTEAISQDQLKNYCKHFTVEDVLEISELCNKVNIHFAHFLILGGYGETEETLDETFYNSSKINNSVFFPFIGMRIYPGTRLAEIAIEESIITKEEDLLIPKYYISDKINLKTIKEKAIKTNKRWIFPDDNNDHILTKMRAKNFKGPLWEYAKY